MTSLYIPICVLTSHIVLVHDSCCLLLNLLPGILFSLSFTQQTSTHSSRFISGNTSSVKPSPESFNSWQGKMTLLPLGFPRIKDLILLKSFCVLLKLITCNFLSPGSNLYTFRDYSSWVLTEGFMDSESVLTTCWG